jgi:hypothetical protein
MIVNLAKFMEVTIMVWVARVIEILNDIEARQATHEQEIKHMLEEAKELLSKVNG